MGYITDFHSHPSFKPYNSQGQRVKPDGSEFTIWDEVTPDPAASKGVAKKLKKILAGMKNDSQSDFNQLVNHGFKSIFCAIHPIERGWFNVNDTFLANIAECLWDLKSEMHIIGYWFTGVPKAKIKTARLQLETDRALDYFIDDTLMEYRFIKQSQEVPGPEGEVFTIAKNYNHYMDLVSRNNALAGILSIEGGHALTYLPGAKNNTMPLLSLPQATQKKIEDATLRNIDRIKGIGDKKSFEPEHAPLYVTLAHFYNNFLAGHARSYFGKMSKVFDQGVGINTGITYLGEKVIDKLLHRDKATNERRVLIDVKHMSLEARKAYYEIAKKKGVPVIFSHGAVNGYSWDTFSGEDRDIHHKSGYFSHVSINLYNEDIRAIIDSDGLIGLATHEGRMPGGEAKRQLDEINRQLIKDPDDERLLRIQRNAYIRLYMGNVFQIISEIDDVKAWDHICIGSDYDGIMDPFDRYLESSDFNHLLGDVQWFLNNPFDIVIYKNNIQEQLAPTDIKRLMFGLDTREIIYKFAFENIERFLKNYFTDEYRLGDGAIA